MLLPTPSFGKLRTPKRGIRRHLLRSSWYDYYAGFSLDFVEDALDQLGLGTGAVLLDPWLGGGTTAQVASSIGLQFRGFDLNPSMLLVARARTFPVEHREALNESARVVAKRYKQNLLKSRKPTRRLDEPLEQWLQPASARAFRELESCVARADSPESLSTAAWSRVSEISAKSAVLYVCLFRTLRYFLSDFCTSNPTWIKLPKRGSRIQISGNRILARFLKEFAILKRALDYEAEILSTRVQSECFIHQASSTDLPLEANSVDAVLSSPPYCTRIDYVRATLPDLAVIGFPNGGALRALRERMIGTPTISYASEKNAEKWGLSCNQFLSRVETHPSKASASYYLKYFRQYFSSTFDSLAEINRVLKKSGKCILVVQDSYYKNLLNNLPLIYSEMADQFGWTLIRKADFPVARTFAGIHPMTRRYRENFNAMESVLIFHKP